MKCALMVTALMWALPCALAAAAASAPEPASAPAQSSEVERLRSFIDAGNREDEATDPTGRTLKNRDGKESAWTPISDAYRLAEIGRWDARRARLPEAVNRERLPEQYRQDYDVYALSLRNRSLESASRARAYFITGNVLNFNILHDPADVLTRSHQIADAQDARNYLTRLETLPALLDEALAIAQSRQADGVGMYRGSMTAIATKARRLSQGAPCIGEGTHAVFADYTAKVAKAAIGDVATSEVQTLIRDAVCPAYARFADGVLALQARARTQGLWAEEQGVAAYQDIIELSLLERVSPDELHALGLREIEALRPQIAKLAIALGYGAHADDLPALTRALAEDPRTSVVNTADAVEAYRQAAAVHVEAIRPLVAPVFKAMPREAPLLVRLGNIGSQYGREHIDGVEHAIYHLQTPDGPRIPLYGLASLSYHEAIPGHHFQRELGGQLAEDAIKFPRPFSSAVGEGWAVYAEHLVDELGVYAGRDADRLGYLLARAERASRLVLHTGLNAKGWTIAQGEAFQRSITGNANLNRFLNWPGQALGYSWGYLKLLDLREKSKARLGDAFDLAEFHDVVLKQGAIPFSMIEAQLDALP